MTSLQFCEQRIHLNVNQNSTQWDLLHNSCHTFLLPGSTLGTKKHFVISQISQTTDIFGHCTLSEAVIRGIRIYFTTYCPSLNTNSFSDGPKGFSKYEISISPADCISEQGSSFTGGETGHTGSLYLV